MPATVTISFGDLDNWLRQLSTRITTADFAPAWKRVGVLLAAGMKKNFAGQHAPDKTPWQPIKQYRARGATGLVFHLELRGKHPLPSKQQDRPIPAL